jgi:hypothetical protein
MTKPLPGLDVPVVNPQTGLMTQVWYDYYQDKIPSSQILGTPSGDSAPAGYVGEIIRNVVNLPGFNLTSGSAGQVWNSISLAAGAWLVGCQSGVFGAAGVTFTHMHSDHGDATTTIQTSPGDGTTTALHITSNNSNGWIFPNGIKPYFLPAAATINAVMTADFTGGTAAAYGTLWAVRFY